jgi:hypothetical protein
MSLIYTLSYLNAVGWLAVGFRWAIKDRSKP